MNAPQKPGAGKNQSGDLDIPKLGAGPIVQPGEEDTAYQPAAAPAPVLPPTAAAPREMSNAEIQAVLAQLATSTANLAQSQQTIMQSLSTMAMNRPVRTRYDADQNAEVPLVELDMPVDGSLDDMRRPDQRVEGVDIDVVRSMNHAEQIAFLEEPVKINIHETAEEGADNPVPLWINGRSHYVHRGVDTVVKRHYVELLLRAKPEAIRTRIIRNGDGDVSNRIEKTRALKYPFSIVQDRNPKGIAWARKIRSEQ